MASAQVMFVRQRVARVPLRSQAPGLYAQAGGRTTHDGGGDLALQGQDVAHLPLVLFHPDVPFRLCGDELRRNPHTIADPSEARLQQVPDAHSRPISSARFVVFL